MQVLKHNDYNTRPLSVKSYFLGISCNRLGQHSCLRCKVSPLADKHNSQWRRMTDDALIYCCTVTEGLIHCCRHVTVTTTHGAKCSSKRKARRPLVQSVDMKHRRPKTSACQVSPLSKVRWTHRTVSASVDLRDPTPSVPMIHLLACLSLCVNVAWRLHTYIYIFFIYIYIWKERKKVERLKHEFFFLPFELKIIVLSFGKLTSIVLVCQIQYCKLHQNNNMISK